jgi:hypothetical protein
VIIARKKDRRVDDISHLIQDLHWFFGKRFNIPFSNHIVNFLKGTAEGQDHRSSVTMRVSRRVYEGDSTLLYDFWRSIILACADSRMESRIKELASDISIPIKSPFHLTLQ